MTFGVLGPLRVWRHGAPLNLGTRPQHLTLALLLARVGEHVPAAEFMDLIWSGNPPRNALRMLHRRIGSIRRLIEPDLLLPSASRRLTHGNAGYRLVLDANELDLVRFRNLVARARNAGSLGQTATALSLYVEALNLWRGPCAGGSGMLPGSHITFESVDRERTAAAGEAAEEALRCAGARLLLPAFRSVLQQTPLDEPLHAKLLLLLCADGKQAEAITTYHDIRNRLADQLGVRPGNQLVSAYRNVLTGSGTTTGTESPPVAVTGRPGPVGGAGSSAAGRLRQHSPRRPQARPAQLPPDLPFFTGRAEGQRWAASLTARTDRQPWTPILAIDGIPGIGKTAFAIHLAHRLAGEFPDGQLYINLHGFAGSPHTVGSGAALRGFLDALGMSESAVPTGLHAQSALYRSILARRRVLVVLDNARDLEQVRPLLPGTAECFVVVTSRNRLVGLTTAHGATLLTLDLPPRGEARDGLAARIGAARLDAEPEAVDDIIDRSGRLPLALDIVAARAAAHPEQQLSVIADELAHSQSSLDGFTRDDAGDDLRTVFSWSYLRLSTRAAEAFRLTAVHPTADLTPVAFASLTGTALREARSLLGELLHTGLLTEQEPGRYRSHDLIRVYAGELVQESTSDDERHLAWDRVYGHYLRGAYAAAGALSSALELDRPDDVTGVTPIQIADRVQATAWFTAERHVLDAVIEREIRDGGAARARQLALTLQPFYQRQERRPERTKSTATVLDPGR